MAGQAKSWAQIKVSVSRLEKTIEDMPAPPTPRDSWSEKVNAMNRVLEGMREQLASEMEQEDLRESEAE